VQRYVGIGALAHQRIGELDFGRHAGAGQYQGPGKSEGTQQGFPADGSACAVVMPVILCKDHWPARVLAKESAM
jgi:hypothetical protein